MFKRRFYDVDYEDRFNKKARFAVSEESIEDKLDELIVKIGEKSTSSIDKNIQDLADIFDFEILPKNTRIVDVFCECIIEFPQKICIYSTLIGLLNARNYSFGGEIVEKIVQTLKNYLKNGNYEYARIMIRFLGDLVNTRVISSSSFVGVLENFVDVTMEDNIPEVRSDYYVYMILSALPWVGKELFEKKELELSQIMSTIDSYMVKRKKMEHYSALKVWHSDNPHPQEEYLDCLWNQIIKLKADKWVEQHIYRPYIHFDNILCESLQHNVVSIKPPLHESSSVYPYPQVVFRLFDYNDCSERSVLPAPTSIERFIVEDNIRWILNQNCFDRKDCATSLLNYSNLSSASKLPMENIIAEVIFGEMFTLPKSRYPEICYGSIFLDLCKLQPSTFPSVLVQAVELLFERLDTMNGACINRFASWFAYHLSNFYFRWSWDDWSYALKYEPLHFKQKFIIETLEYCLRFSYHSTILDNIPKSFHKLAPPLPTIVNRFLSVLETDFEPDNEIDKYAKEYGQIIINGLTEKASPEEMWDILTEIPGDDMGLKKLKIEIFINALLKCSSRSLTHTFSFISKYRSVLKQLITCEEDQLNLLNAILEIWHQHQQLLVILIDKLVKSEILEHKSVAIWIFSKANMDEFMKFYMWEILHSTIKKTISNIKKCTKELEELKAKLNESIDTSMGEGEDNSDEIEKLEEKLDSAEGQLKNLFLVIFQRFIMILTEHIQSCEAKDKSFRNYWFFWTMSRLQEVFFLYNEYIIKYNNRLETLLFTNDLDSNILMIFKQFLHLTS